MKQSSVKNHIGGEFVDCASKRIDVISPLDGSTLSTVPLSTSAEVDAAVQSASQAYPSWASKTVKERALQRLLTDGYEDCFGRCEM